MHFVDWAIVISFITFLTIMVLFVNKYVKHVSSFLSARRCAGRYMMAVAAGTSSLGAITIVAQYEAVYNAGLVVKWWETMFFPVSLIVAVTGWVVYRFRETRAMTVAQFFEMRYSRNFRIYAGVLAFISGILNFGIFPQVGARFFLYFCDLPQNFYLWDIQFSTHITIMALLLMISLFYAYIGGQVAIMVTDFIQGALFNIGSVVIIVFLLVLIGWPTIMEGLQFAPPQESRVNPFKTANIKDFNFLFFLVKAFMFFYCVRAFQGSQGYFSAAKSPHEQKMAGVIGQWRNYILLLLMVLVPVSIYTIMHHPDFIHHASQITSELDKISTDPANHDRQSMLVPIGISHILPKGLTGLMCAMVLAAFISTHDTYMHSWGSILIQDVIMPFRKKPFKPKVHMLLLKLSIAGVAVFVFFFSIFFELEEYIFMFMAITGSIYLAGAGSAIIGGLYWKKGSTAAAYTVLTFGAVTSTTAIIVRQVYPDFSVNSQLLFGMCMVSCIILYVVISFFSRQTCNMDKLLNRGKYAIGDEKTVEISNDKGNLFSKIWHKLITKEFTSMDKKLYALTIAWVMMWVVIFLIGSLLGLIIEIPDLMWMKYWTIWLWINFSAMVIGVIWLLVGGVIDLRSLFVTLANTTADENDDGWVEQSQHCETDDKRIKKQ